jgi:hypothetical protein
MPGLAALTCIAAISPLASQAAGPKHNGLPVVVTGSVSHVRGISAELDGTVIPGSQTTSYYFQYGPTPAYGSQTTPGSLPPGTTRVKVGQTVTGLLPGYHYRLVATSLAGPSPSVGKDKTYTVKTSVVRFSVTKPTAPSIFGSPLTIAGTLTGPGNANRMIELQSSPYPYLEPFLTFGTPILTNAAGAFLFHVSGLATSTQFRVATLDPRPIYSPQISERLAVRVTLHVRTSASKGLVRLYGTVSPAVPGAQVFFQLRKATRPGKSEQTTKFATQFQTKARRATKSTSRFSAIVEVRRGGRYRAFVEVKKGALVSGSSPTVVLAAAPVTTKKKH